MSTSTGGGESEDWDEWSDPASERPGEISRGLLGVEAVRASLASAGVRGMSWCRSTPVSRGLLSPAKRSYDADASHSDCSLGASRETQSGGEAYGEGTKFGETTTSLATPRSAITLVSVGAAGTARRAGVCSPDSSGVGGPGCKGVPDCSGVPGSNGVDGSSGVPDNSGVLDRSGVSSP